MITGSGGYVMTRHTNKLQQDVHKKWPGKNGEWQHKLLSVGATYALRWEDAQISDEFTT